MNKWVLAIIILIILAIVISVLAVTGFLSSLVFNPNNLYNGYCLLTKTDGTKFCTALSQVDCQKQNGTFYPTLDQCQNAGSN